MSRPTRQSQAGRVYLDLQNRARREKRGTQELLTLYVVERWLARLGRSEYVDNFVLKAYHRSLVRQPEFVMLGGRPGPPPLINLLFPPGSTPVNAWPGAIS